jgi:NADP-dependent 3-hydroxy acid dehydrogenase YdfG
MELVLDGRVALVTGASSGIGEAAARALAALGASVSLVARCKDRLERVAAEIMSAGGRAVVLKADVAQRVQAAEAVERTVAALGRLDIVINNAGVMHLGPLVGAPVAEWDQMINLNLLGFLYIAHAALPHLLMAAEDSPRRIADLVNIGSVAGRIARAGSGVYNLTKFGVGAFSESLRQEITGRHVRVAVVEPGAVITELGTHMRPEIQELWAKRVGDIEKLHATDISDAIIYIVTRPRHVAINEILIRPTEQLV